MINPTPEQIEAGAKALYCAVRALDVRDFEEWPEHVLRDKYRSEARDALVAAAGAAPQEPPMTIADLNRAFGSKTGGPPSFTAESEGDEFLFGRPRFPAQVDEAKLAELIGWEAPGWDNRKELASLFQDHCAIPDEMEHLPCLDCGR